MELKDTVELMQSADYRERFIAEYYQLKIRRDKLENLLDKYKAKNLVFVPSSPYDLLHEQLIHMTQYLRVLEDRAKNEYINLDEEE